MFDKTLIDQQAAELQQAEKTRVQVEHFSKRFPGMTVEDGSTGHSAALNFRLFKAHHMQRPINTFKQALQNRRPQTGLWMGLADSYETKICAGAGFDWRLSDGEYAPNDLRSVVQQLQTMAGYPTSHPIARLPMGDGHVGEMLVKQYLEVGALFVAVSLDTNLLVKHTSALASRFKSSLNAMLASKIY